MGVRKGTGENRQRPTDPGVNATGLNQFRGMLDHQRCRDSAAYERANYIRVFQGWRV